MKLFDHYSLCKHEIIKPIELASITIDFQMLEDVSMELKHVLFWKCNLMNRKHFIYLN